ncbi:hypothetical protein Tco_0111906 [Tanacetum coccineum]
MSSINVSDDFNLDTLHLPTNHQVHLSLETRGQSKFRIEEVIMEYLVNISKRRAFWSLNEDILKITILKTNTPYPSRKIQHICVCTHQRPERNKAQYAVSKRSQYAVSKIFSQHAFKSSQLTPTCLHESIPRSGSLLFQSVLTFEVSSRSAQVAPNESPPLPSLGPLTLIEPSHQLLAHARTALSLIADARSVFCLPEEIWNECMTRSSTTELFTPYKKPKREFRSSRRHFKSLSLDELRSPDFNLFSDQEYSEEEEAEAMAEIMEQILMSKTATDIRSRELPRPKIKEQDSFELKDQFLKELQENTFSGSDNEDVKEHIEKFLEIVDLFHVPNITKDQLMLRVFPISLTEAAKMQEVGNLFTMGLDVPTRQILDSRGAIPTKTAADAKKAIQGNWQNTLSKK